MTNKDASEDIETEYEYEFGFPINLPKVLDDLQKAALVSALKEAEDNFEVAAKLLGLTTKAFVAALKRYQIRQSTRPFTSKIGGKPWVQ